MEVTLTPQEPARQVRARIRRADEIVKRHGKSTLNLFKVNDHYETYGRDAVYISQITGVRLNTRFKIDMIEFTLTAADIYFPKIVREGFKICVHENL